MNEHEKIVRQGVAVDRWRAAGGLLYAYFAAMTSGDVAWAQRHALGAAVVAQKCDSGVDFCSRAAGDFL
jgi:hypothetical protein